MNSELLNGEALQVARYSRGHSQKDVGDAAGVSQGMISKAEDGSTPLTAEAVEAVARYLGYPVEFFYEPDRIREVGSACLYHRKRKTLPATILRKLDARMYIRNVNVHKLFADLDVEGQRIFHTLDPDEFGGPVEVARRLRAAWRIPEGPIPNLTALIESAGGIVVMEDFGTHKLFGMSCWTTRGHPLFFLNSAIPAADLRWTLAHELGHLTMHHVVPSEDPEDQADAFAGEFLTPQAAFRPSVRRLTFDRLPQLKAHWRISMKAVIVGATKVGAIDKQTSVRLYKQHSAHGYNRAEPFPLSPEPPSLVRQAVDVHLSEHGYSVEELARVVRLDPDEFSREFLGRELQPNVVSLFERPSAVPTV